MTIVAAKAQNTETVKIYYVRGKELLALRGEIEDIKKEYLTTNALSKKSELDEIIREKEMILKRKEHEFQELYPGNIIVDEQSVAEAQKQIFELMPPDTTPQ